MKLASDSYTFQFITFLESQLIQVYLMIQHAWQIEESFSKNIAIYLFCSCKASFKTGDGKREVSTL